MRTTIITTPNIWAFTKSKEQAQKEELQKRIDDAKKMHDACKQTVEDYCRVKDLANISPELAHKRMYMLFAPVYAMAMAWELAESCRLTARDITDVDDDIRQCYRELSHNMNRCKERYDQMVRERITEELRRIITRDAVRKLNEIRPNELHRWRKSLMKRFPKDAPEVARMRANALIAYLIVGCVEVMQDEFGNDLAQHTDLPKILGVDFCNKTKLPYTVEAFKAAMQAYVAKDLRSTISDKRVKYELWNMFKDYDFHSVKEYFQNSK